MMNALSVRTSIRVAVGLAALLSWAVAAAPAEGAPAPADPAAGSEDLASGQKQSLAADFDALVAHLHAAGALGDLSKKERKAVLQAVLRELGYADFRNRPAPADSGESTQAPAASERVVPLNEWCVTLLLTRLDPDVAAALNEQLKDRTDSSAEKPWMILDLRQATNGTKDAVAPLLEMLELQRKPLMVLVGARTGKTAQILLGRLREKKAAVTVGSPAGCPAETRQLRLPSGLTLEVPDFAGRETPVSYGAKPDIRVEAKGQHLPADVGDRDDAALQRMLLRDPAVRRALDTLIAVRAFATPHF